MAETLLVLGRPAAPLREQLLLATTDFHVVMGTQREDFVEAAPLATLALCWGPPRALLQQVVEMAPQLRWVHIHTAGINHLLFPELAESPLVLTNAKGVYSPSLGEWVLAAMLYFAKELRRLERQQAQGLWAPFDVLEVAGQTVGIVGYGDIGRAVAVRAHAVGMRVLGLSRRGAQGDISPAEQVFGPEGLHDLIGQSDYLVVTAPLTPATQGMIGPQEIAAMKPDAVLINIGRGPIVQEDALLQALAAGRIKGAALDVFDQEPLPPGHPFFSLENVLLSPHCADNTPDWLDRSLQLYLCNLERYRRGGPLLNVVDKARGY